MHQDPLDWPTGQKLITTTIVDLDLQCWFTDFCLLILKIKTTPIPKSIRTTITYSEPQ
jgi:hypothetical protein